MKDLKIAMATDVFSGKTIPLDIDPRVYTSVHEWKPITPERFAQLLHQYQTMDENLDDHGNGLMHSKASKLDRDTTAVIHYSMKRPGGAVRSPVLMSIEYSSKGKVICFASLIYGIDSKE